ncbi:MAG: asparagine synthase (glutamine-hydrolyzing), partial [Xanthomonadaceae bacterium]|nr:asparagine synthase (glutamine-hydrolyzing) [Xanthomonadaceae bacterium]
TIRSKGDDQPPLLVGADDVVVVCNGEIDNHRELRVWLEERGHRMDRDTDVAVIGPLYLETGLAFVEHLQGVFAVAIWDPGKKQLILARDRTGERHMYFCHAEDGTTCFASELSALKAGQESNLPINTGAVADYLARGFCVAPQSALHGVQKLQPAEIVRIDCTGIRRHRYWRSPMGVAPRRDATVPMFDDIFRHAVRRQTDVQVDYGVLLSGGVDSALLAAVARSVRPDKLPTAYSIRFNEASYDEGLHAQEIARLLACPFVPITVHALDVPATLSDLIQATGELIADPAWVPMALIAQRAAQDVPMVISGEGADELFGGYPTYLGARLAHYFAGLPATLRAALTRVVERIPVSDKKVAITFLLKRFIQGQELDGVARHALWTASIQPDVLERLGIRSPAAYSHQGTIELLDAVQLHDFRHALPEALLVKTDRGGMRHAVEVRAPFLDQAVVNFAAHLSVRNRVHRFNTKVFLKRYATRYLPRQVVNRRKRGLSVPLATWLRGPLFDWTASRLSSPTLKEVGVDTRVAVDLLMEHRDRRHDHSRALWTLAVLSEWLEWANRRIQVEAGKSEMAYAAGSEH